MEPIAYHCGEGSSTLWNRVAFRSQLNKTYCAALEAVCFRTGAGDLLNCRQLGRLTSATSLGVCRVQLEKREWNTHRDHYSRFVQGTRISHHSITLSATCLPAHIPEENRKDKSFLLIPQLTFKWNKLHARTDIIDDGCGKSKNHICLIEPVQHQGQK